MFDLPTDEDYYEPIITKSAFNNNYIQYESGGNKDKNLSVEEYLDRIKPYLSDIINNHKTQGTWRIHYPDNKTQSEWKIQLAMEINFIFSKKKILMRPVPCIQKVII